MPSGTPSRRVEGHGDSRLLEPFGVVVEDVEVCRHRHSGLGAIFEHGLVPYQGKEQAVLLGVLFLPLCGDVVMGLDQPSVIEGLDEERILGSEDVRQRLTGVAHPQHLLEHVVVGLNVEGDVDARLLDEAGELIGWDVVSRREAHTSKSPSPAGSSPPPSVVSVLPPVVSVPPPAVSAGVPAFGCAAAI